MTARLMLILSVGVAFALSGCVDGSDTKFVVNERTSGLHTRAREAIEGALLENFGAPTNLVAWLELPVDFGRLEATVSASATGETPSITRTFVADFAADIPDDLGGLALLWQSGKYQGKQLQVSSYDAESKQVVLTQNMEPPPQAGDKFIVVGHRLTYGRTLYMKHCMHCHGVSGDGNGPTAKYLNPKPRDYRQGMFKFTSTKQQDRARRDDLRRTVKLGIPGTYMPSFMLLSDSETDALVEYVRWLSLRGEFENKLDAELEGDYSKAAVKQRVEQGETQEEIDAALEQFLTEDLPGISEEAGADLATTWNRAEQPEQLVVPGTNRTKPDADSLARGRALYLSAKAKCAACHGTTGRGDGPQTEDIQQGYTEPGLFDQWKNEIKPRNLTRGLYRGGRRPIDLYRRIYAGIKGTPMPAFGGTVLNDNEIWDLVNYVMSIPYAKTGSTTGAERNQVASQAANPHGG